MTITRQGFLWLGILAVVLTLLFYLRQVLLPFVAAGLLAYLLDPIVQAMHKRRCPRGLASFFVLLLALLTITGVFLMLAPLIQVQIASLSSKLPIYIERLQQASAPLLAELQKIAPHDSLVENLPSLLKEQAGTAASIASRLTGVLIAGSLQALSLISLLFLTPVIAFYLLRDWPLMLNTIDSWFPRAYYTTIHEQLREVDATIAGFIRGQLIVCVALAGFYAIGLSITGLEFGFIIGIFSGILSFIPYVGSFTGGILSLGMALAQWGIHDWKHLSAVALVYGVGQFVEGNILSPKLVGSRVNLHPVWIIFALFAGGTLYGFLGVLLAVPVTAVIGVLTRFIMQQYRISTLYGTKEA
jgi:predicted PurR-regulated permease PerM